MKNPRTKRTLLSPGLIITTLLLVASVQIASLPQAMALEPGGLSPAAIPQPKGTVLYVSRAGDDAWSGKLAEPNSANTDGPFATIARARDAIRVNASKQPLRKPVTVYVRGGVYTLSAPLVFLPEDSGTAKGPITYAAYPGEKVVLSGGRAITGWKKAAEGGEENRPELWTAEVPGVKEGQWYFHQLFVDGQRRQRARSPNAGFLRADGIFQAGDPSHFKFHPGDIHAAWVEQGDVEVVGLERWGEFRLTVKAVDPDTNTATLSGPRQDYGNDKDARYWVENAADALDSPGEWYLDRRSGTVSYLALPGEDVRPGPVRCSRAPAVDSRRGQCGNRRSSSTTSCCEASLLRIPTGRSQPKGMRTGKPPLISPPPSSSWAPAIAVSRSAISFIWANTRWRFTKARRTTR